MDIKIERPSPTCNVCSRAFSDGEELTTALIQIDDVPNYKRQDICSTCFPKYDSTTLHCFWSNSFSERRRSPLLDSDVLWQVFHASHPKASEEQRSSEFAYVAALGLMRLKQLVLESTKRAGDQEYLVMRTRGKASERQEFEVLVPSLDEAGIERVQDQLADFDGSDDDSSSTSEEQPTAEQQS